MKGIKKKKNKHTTGFIDQNIEYFADGGLESKTSKR